MILLAASLGAASNAQAQFQSRWRDQRPATSRPSPYLSLLGNGGNRALIYQGIVRPQLDLQSQIRTQDRQIDRFMSSTRESQDIEGRTTSLQRSPASAQRPLESSATADRLRTPMSGVTRVDVGHPVYFQYRDQYFPGFRRQGSISQ
jgi:hypothetical protein